MVIVGLLILLAVLYGIHAVVDELGAIRSQLAVHSEYLAQIRGYADAEHERVKGLADRRGTGRELLAQRLAARLEGK